MSHTLAIAGGGALGALLRFWVSSWVYGIAGRSFPWGTLAVNVFGSLVMGIVYVWLVERSILPAEWRAFVMVGLLGAFTTFSTFSIETFHLIEGGEPFRALMNVALSASLCVGAAWIGVAAGRQWL